MSDHRLQRLTRVARGVAMELPGSGYLYTIATLSIAYAGFAALIVIFRQIIGGGVSSYDVFEILMRSFMRSRRA